MKIIPGLRTSIIVSLLFIAGCASRERSHNEAVLREDLYLMRTAIDQYTQDKKIAPQHLTDLVSSGYLHAIPKDPFTNSATTWSKCEKIHYKASRKLNQVSPMFTAVLPKSPATVLATTAGKT
jgi:hypothetical protein